MRIKLVWMMIFLIVPAVNALSVSQAGGFYTSALSVTLSGNQNNTLRYTLDVSDPLTGTIVTGPVFITSRPSAPSALATNPETSLYPIYKPTSTLKATILRAVEIDPSGKVISNISQTYFIGLNENAFTNPIFSVVIDDKYLQDYNTGMIVKGATYYNDFNMKGGNPTNPFRPANWNNDSLRWPANYELYVNGATIANDKVMFYPSGQWSAALAKKSFKIKYDKAVGPAQTTIQLFGTESPSSMNKVWLKNGGQDFNGLGLRDCIAAEIINTDLNVEETQCAQAALFINGEYYGAFNINQDIDAKLLANKYGIDKDDVVLLEKDGLVEEGKKTDNAPYFALKSWLMNSSTDLSNDADYQYFKSKVNTDSLIDYYATHMYFNNNDFPSDHRMWRNKNTASQEPGTPYDGRWYFQPKDLDQTVGLYNHITSDENTITDFLSRSGHGYIFFTKAMENPEFKQQFITRNLQLLDTTFSTSHVNAVVDRIASERRPEVSRDKNRWEKPYNWENDLVAYKKWMGERNINYRGFINALGNLTTVPPQINTTNGTDTTPPPTNTTETNTGCHTNLDSIPSSCIGGTITSDSWIGGCRTITCTGTNGALTTKACPKSTHFEMWPVSKTETAPTACIGITCFKPTSGFMRSPDYPICTGTSTTNQTNTTTPPQTNNTSSGATAQLRVADWYPKQLHPVFICSANEFTPSTYDFTFGDGEKTANYAQNNVYKIYAAPGTYTATCTAKQGTTTAQASTTVTVTE